MATVLISGGTGLIGRHLCSALKNRGYDVAVLSRGNWESGEFRTFRWDPEKGEIEEGAIESVDYIIHLAGTNLGEKRWTPKQKQIIVDSRVKTANLIFKKVTEINHPLKAFISSSAVGYYGCVSAEKELDEADPPGKDFLAEVCLKWEEAADQFQEKGIRTVKIRSGVVLSRRGGVLAQMKVPVRSWIGSPLGTGRQYVSWIHIEDLCSIYIKAIEDNRMRGAYNAVAPGHTTNAEFMQTLAHVLKNPFWFPRIPSFMLELILGERASLVLEGNRISAGKILHEGFEFKYPDLEIALRNLML